MASERGSAVVGFVLVGALVALLFAGVLQLTIALHVRNTLIDCAAEGARRASTVGSSPDDGAQRARDLITQSLSAAYAQDVSVRRGEVDGLAVIEVEVVAPLPVAGLLGPGGSLTVVAHAVAEEP